MGKKRYYAVRAGRAGPSIYSTWDECKAQVDGYPGAVYKGFATRAEAENFVDGALAANRTTTAIEDITGGFVPSVPSAAAPVKRPRE